MRFKVTSPFGALEEFRERPHSGIDFNFPEGTPVKAIADGIVHIKDFGDVNAGKTVLLEMDDGKTAIFGHLKDFVVKDGQRVSANDLLAHSGNTGHSTGEHLHFGLKETATGRFLDPSSFQDNIQNMATAPPPTKGLWQKFLERGEVNNFEHADFSIWQDILGIPGDQVAIIAGVVILLLMYRPIRGYIIGVGAAVLLIFGGVLS